MRFAPPLTTHLLLAVVGLAAASAPPAQCTKPCWGFNDNTTFDSKTSMGGPNLWLAIKIRLQTTVPAQRLEVFTGKKAGAGKLSIWSHDSKGNKPKALLSGGSYLQNATVTWQGANLTKPQVLLAKTDYWIVWSMPNGSQASITSRNTTNTGLEYRGSFNAGTSWNGPFRGLNWKLRIYCCKKITGSFVLFGSPCGPKGKQPNLSGSGIPTVGKTYVVSAKGASPTKPALLGLGASKNQWGPLKLPFDLTALGAPSCKILASVDVTGSALTNSSGSVSFSIPVPNQPALTGVIFHHQIWVFDTSVNKFGIVSSQGATVTLGG